MSLTCATQIEVHAREDQADTTHRRLKFGDDVGFHRELKRKVDAYFQATGKRRRDCPRMYLKTAIIFGWAGASYLLLVFVASAWWTALPLAVSLGVAMAAIGFNIQHDGGHGSYSDARG